VKTDFFSGNLAFLGIFYILSCSPAERMHEFVVSSKSYCSG
jgi:hypothetical protein